jgi:uncharacterized protein (TIRG00374 family)
MFFARLHYAARATALLSLESWMRANSNSPGAVSRAKAGPAYGDEIREPRLWGWHSYASLALAVAILTGLALLVDFRVVWEHLRAADWGLVTLGMLAHYATYPVRGYRWQRCLTRSPIAAGTGQFGLIVFFYNFVDNLVPAKLGDIYAAHMARINFGIRRSTALGSLVFLRMVDAWLVLALAVLSAWLLFAANVPTTVAWGLGGGLILAVAVSGVLIGFAFLGRSIPSWVPERVAHMIEAFHGAMLPERRETGRILVSTLVIWALETLWIYLLLLGFGADPGFAEVVFLTMLPLLASGFPLTPSGAGVVELTLFGSLRLVGVAGPLAVSITVLNRFIDYWMHIALGLLVWGLRRQLGLRTWREVPLSPTTATKPT